LNTARLALQTFRERGMLYIDDDSFIRISKWEKDQNAEGMERVRELNAERHKRHRARKQQQQALESKTDDGSVTSRDGTEVELERHKEKDIAQEQDKDVARIIQFWDKNGFGVNNIHAKKQLLLWLDDASFKEPSDVILKALNIACENDARR